ncbi:MAG: aldolase catalytic domain-containing protein [Clostridia bacterium]|nr:aldolase catalytic domain-containing protein [Clostridia bacterium]
MNYDLKLLDCTLRDGGYVNNWNWGFEKARQIINLLVKSNVDIVEVGFLRNVDNYNPHVTVCNRIEELNKLLPTNHGNTMFSAMAMRSNYDISKLRDYSGNGIEMIRITAHDYDIKDGMDFAREVKSKGYKLSINPINIMGYSDNEILWILDQVNQIQPYQFSIVDTFGSMKRRDLDRIVSIADNNLDSNIRLALHLHENMSMGFHLAQNFVDKHLNRPVSVDASLMGMGRIPGNLPIELIADYLNDYTESNYDIDHMMDAIQDYISPLKGNTEWGYTPAYFLSARYNLHRNYAEYYLNKGDLTNRDINHILSRFDNSKKTAFDSKYADSVYEKYKNNIIDDSEDRKNLSTSLRGKKIVVIAPGSSIVQYHDTIGEYANQEDVITFSVNFIPTDYSLNYAFFSNNKRFDSITEFSCKTIVTSNLKNNNADYVINYNTLSGAFDQGCNSLIMLLKLLKDMDVEKVYLAGADGYSMDGQDYYSDSLRSYSVHDNSFNLAVSEAIKKIDINLSFITPSGYSR